MVIIWAMICRISESQISLLLEIVLATSNYDWLKPVLRPKRNAVLKGRFDKLLTLLDSLTDMVSAGY